MMQTIMEDGKNIDSATGIGMFDFFFVGHQSTSVIAASDQHNTIK
jgi:hypothetical protein